MLSTMLAERIKVARTAAGLTQEQLAGRIGVKDSAITHLETHKTKSLRATNALRLSAALDVRVEWLVFGDEPMRPPAGAYSRNALALAALYDQLHDSRKIQLREFAAYLAGAERGALSDVGEVFSAALEHLDRACPDPDLDPDMR